MTTNSDLEKKLLGLGLISQPVQIHRLQGDASNRIYHRVAAPEGSFILMERPMAGSESPSEEKTKDVDIQEYPFLNVGRYLESVGIRTPEIIGKSPDESLILLEDIGECTLEKSLRDHPQSTRTTYEKALQLLQTWQKRTAQADEKCVAFQRKFDRDIMEWEFDHFLEWGLIKGNHAEVSAKERDELTRIFRDMAGELAECKTVLMHRDYQSRNIMITPNQEFVILDFQDACQGPFIYDAVALLRDSYISLSEEDLLHLQKYFFELQGEKDFKNWTYLFDLQTAQRKLKDGGRFFYIDQVKGNPDFFKTCSSILFICKSCFKEYSSRKIYSAHY